MSAALHDGSGSTSDQEASARTPLVLGCGVEPESIACAAGQWNSRVVAFSDLPHASASEPVSVLVLGPLLACHQALAAVEDFSRNTNGARPAIIVFGVGDALAQFQECLDRGDLYYIAAGHLHNDVLTHLMEAAVGTSAGSLEAPSPELAKAAKQVLGDVSAAASDEDVYLLLKNAVTFAFPVAEVSLWLYSSARDELQRLGDGAWSTHPQSPATGLVGYAVRTGRAATAHDAVRDPRFEPSVDCGGRRGSGIGIYVQPVVSLAGVVEAVVVIAQRALACSPSSPECRLLESQAISIAGALEARRAAMQRMAKRLEEAGVLHGALMYRAEAIQHEFAREAPLAEPPRTSPDWSRRTMWMCALFVASVTTFATLVKTGEVVGGPAVVRARVKTTIIAPASGVLGRVQVALGDRVEGGARLAGIAKTSAAAGDERLESQIVAPHSGLIAAVAARPGTWVARGDPIVTIVDDLSGYEIVSFVEVKHALRVRPGDRSVVSLDGFGVIEEMPVVSEVAQTALLPQEVARYLGNPSRSTNGTSVVLLRHALTAASFVSSSGSYQFVDGLSGTAEIALQAQSLLEWAVAVVGSAVSR